MKTKLMALNFSPNSEKPLAKRATGHFVRFLMFALMLCMGAFLFPMTAFAAADADTEPPTIKAWIEGELLFIEATDSGSGVEAVFIDDERVNYRVDGGLALAVGDYGDEGDTLSIYAIDFAGNKSDTATVDIPIKNPPAQPNPFTPSGQATVVDQAADSDGKDFYTFTTPEGNVFYLVIDHQRESENVYFLNAVTENDLLALAESSGNGNSGAIPTPDPVTQPDPEPTSEPEPEAPEKESGGNGTMIFIVIAIIAIGGAGYYIKIVRPKQQAAAFGDDDDDMDDEDDEEMDLPQDGDDEDYPEDEDDYPDEGGDHEAEDE